MARMALSTWALRASCGPGAPAPSVSMLKGGSEGHTRSEAERYEDERAGDLAKSLLLNQMPSVLADRDWLVDRRNVDSCRFR